MPTPADMGLTGTGKIGFVYAKGLVPGIPRPNLLFEPDLIFTGVRKSGREFCIPSAVQNPLERLYNIDVKAALVVFLKSSYPQAVFRLGMILLNIRLSFAKLVVWQSP